MCEAERGVLIARNVNAASSADTRFIAFEAFDSYCGGKTWFERGHFRGSRDEMERKLRRSEKEVEKGAEKGERERKVEEAGERDVS